MEYFIALQTVISAHSKLKVLLHHWPNSQEFHQKPGAAENHTIEASVFQE